MRIKMILPALLEAESPAWRPVKYSLFPPLGLATLASFCDPNDDVTIVDQHVESLNLDDLPDLVVIQVYITNAYRAYAIADSYRQRGVYVVLGGLHPTSMPIEAAQHADSIFLGPGEETFPLFLKEFRAKKARQCYESSTRTLTGVPPIRRDLIKRNLYLVPNSIVVSRGCPFHCSFCYKDAFFKGGKSYYTQKVDDALAEIERLPGRHLYFLDDHLLGHRKFAAALFEGMRGMGRLFQGAATVDSILRGDLIEQAADAGLRSLFVGFESVNSENHLTTGKIQNVNRDYDRVVKRLDDLGIMINGSFVFGLDHDDSDVFDRTVEWAVNQGITTATYHIATPYPGTAYHSQLEAAGRIISQNWDHYDTRHVVFKPRNMNADTLLKGYHRAYKEFYSWRNILTASQQHASLKHRSKHFFYSAGWRKFEPFWDVIIKARRLNNMTPLLEGILAKVSSNGTTDKETEQTAAQRATAITESPIQFRKV
ncbi:MAG: radical SAM protein [Granulosicoccus sp.]|nr:radical SAM protein [Granulosicoccus sp.]